MEMKYVLENKILTLVKQDNGCSVHFEYDETDFVKTVSAYTINPLTGASFLMKTETGQTVEEALEKIHKHLRFLHEKTPFTVEWAGPNTQGIVKSYFYVHDMLDVMQTFYKDKNRVDYIIYKCQSNPLT